MLDLHFLEKCESILGKFKLFNRPPDEQFECPRRTQIGSQDLRQTGCSRSIHSQRLLGMHHFGIRGQFTNSRRHLVGCTSK